MECFKYSQSWLPCKYLLVAHIQNFWQTPALTLELLWQPWKRCICRYQAVKQEQQPSCWQSNSPFAHWNLIACRRCCLNSISYCWRDKRCGHLKVRCKKTRIQQSLVAYQDEYVTRKLCWQAWGCLVTKREHFGGMYSSGLICKAFNGHFGNKQTHCKLF